MSKTKHRFASLACALIVLGIGPAPQVAGQQATGVARPGVVQVQRPAVPGAPSLPDERPAQFTPVTVASTTSAAT